LADYGDAPSLGDLGPPFSLADHLAGSDMQMIAAMPVSKFVPVQKFLPHELVFGLRTSANTFPQPPTPTSQLWSEPIFFFPNGRTSNAHLAVCMPDGKRHCISISVRGLTGTARIGELEVMP
jgi:hypothetical protein